MKSDFLSGINTRLFTIPVLFILAAYFAIGIWFYFWGSAYLLEDFHAAQLVTMLSDKKSSVELWFDARKKAADEISKNESIAENLNKILRAQELPKDASDQELKKLKDASADAAQQITRALEDFSQFRSISFVSKQGKVIWSTNSDLINHDWPDKELVAKGPPSKSLAVIGRAALSAPEELFFSAPLSAEENDNDIRVIAQPSPADLAASLRVEKGFYETGKVSIIDGNGAVIAATDMTESGKVRYNVRPGGLDGVAYRNGLFYSIALLKSEPLRLIATLDSTEAAKPIKPLMTIYFSFAALVIAVIIVQVIFIGPRFLGKPVMRLVKAAQAIGEGDIRQINLRKGYTGELKILAEAFSQLIVALNRKSTVPDSDAHAAEISRRKTLLTDAATSVIRARLEKIDRKLESGDLAGNGDTDVEIKNLMMLIDDIKDLVRLWDGASKSVKKEMQICEMLEEMEEICRGFTKGKEIEVIVECNQNLKNRKIFADGKTLKRLAASMLRNAIRSTEIGTVTLLPSIIQKDGEEFLELAVSDTAMSDDPKLFVQALNKGVFFSPSLELVIARELTGLLEGSIAFDNTRGKGSLLTVLIPLSGRSAETAEVVD